jgi:hypothetical protein
MFLKLIYFISVFCWFLPPFKHYKGYLFYYFLILALLDPLTLALSLLIHIHPLYLFLFAGIALLFSLQNSKVNFYFSIIPLVLLSVILIYYLTLDEIKICIAIIHIVIMLFILKEAILRSIKGNALDIFYFILMLYEITIILKFVSLAFNINLGIYYFHFTTIVEIIFAIFFSLFRDDDKRIRLRINPI